MYTHRDYPTVIDHWSRSDLIEQNNKDWKNHLKQLAIIKQLKEENKQLKEELGKVKEELGKVKEQARFVLVQNETIDILMKQLDALEIKLSKYKRIIDDKSV